MMPFDGNDLKYQVPVQNADDEKPSVMERSLVRAVLKPRWIADMSPRKVL
jgi:hypothetical protein